MTSSSPPSSFEDEESDWEFANADDADSMGGDDAEWVITEKDGHHYVSNRSMSGVFISLGGLGRSTSFISLHPSSQSSSSLDPFSIVPTSFSAAASSKGLLLSRGPWSTYQIANPSSGAHTIIPKPHPSHQRRSPLALIVLGRSVYHVICAVALDDSKASYTISTFSSSVGGWRSSGEVFELGHIVPNTGVSCGSCSYWRTKTPEVAAYSIVTGIAWTLMPPLKVMVTTGDRWQLGRAGDRLCCVLVMDGHLDVYALGVKDQWELVCTFRIVYLLEEEEVVEEDEEEEWSGGDTSIVCRSQPWPLRFESDEPEVLLMVDGKLVLLGLEKSRNMKVVDCGGEAPAPLHRYNDFVPYIDNPMPSVLFASGK